MSNINNTYRNLLDKILTNGQVYEDPNRKGVLRKQIPSAVIQYNLVNGYPIIGIKQTYPKAAFNEMKAFTMGITTLKGLHELGIKFWDQDAFNYFKRTEVAINVSRRPGHTEIIEITDDPKFKNYFFDAVAFGAIEGDLGKIYSYQMRKWGGYFDQLDNVLERLKVSPRSTKNVVTMWNPAEADECALTPCHRDFEFLVEGLNVYERKTWALNNFSEGWCADAYDNVKESEWSTHLDKFNTPKYKLSIKWNQHSVDTFLGLPMNIMYYADMVYTFAHYLNMVPGRIEGHLTNVHLYDNTWDKAKDVLNRSTGVTFEPVHIETSFPHHWENLDDYLRQLDFDTNIKLTGYKHLGRVDAEMLPYSN